MRGARSRSLSVLVRLALIGIGVTGSVVQAIRQPDSIRAQPPMTFGIAPVALLFGVIGVLFVIGIQAVNPWSAKVWTRPSWSENPIAMRQPCQFFHLVAWSVAASGVAGVVVGAAAHRIVCPEFVVYTAFGVGIGIGVSLVPRLFSWRFAGAPGPEEM